MERPCQGPLEVHKYDGRTGWKEMNYKDELTSRRLA